jgi:ribonucleoside-diphosphate reductase alpha chain
MNIFIEEWAQLMSSGTGERGIFNREIQFKRPREGEAWICNPCSEIILRPNQFCNLTEVVVRPRDTLTYLCEKVKIATTMGVIQSTLTDFKFLSPEWKKNCEEERLLGVSLTGTCDHYILGKNEGRLEDWLTTMRETAINVARRWSKRLGISMSTAVTCVKPSGNVSQLVNSSSGIHARYAPYYIRRVRISKADPLCTLLIGEGVPHDPEVGTTMENCTTMVFAFPVKSPKNSVFRGSSAIEQLEYWKAYQLYWCEHKPSITVYVKEDEWLEVGGWVYRNWKIVSGVSFLPYDGGIYQLPPYEEITKEKYDEVVSTFPNINFKALEEYEKDDHTEGAREYACVGGGCSE